MKKLICVFLLLVTAFIVFAEPLDGSYWNSLNPENQESFTTGIIEGQVVLLYVIYSVADEQEAMALAQYLSSAYDTKDICTMLTAFYITEDNIKVPIYQAYLYVIGKIRKVGDDV